MKPELKDVIHFYLFADVITEDGRIGMLSDIGVAGPDKSIAMLTVRYSEKEDDWDVFNDDLTSELPLRVKPVLRKIEDMTEDEFNEFSSLFDGPVGQSMSCHSVRNGIFVQLHIESSAYATKKLCEMGFDIFNLIPRALAVDRKEILK